MDEETNIPMNWSVKEPVIAQSPYSKKRDALDLWYPVKPVQPPIIPPKVEVVVKPIEKLPESTIDPNSIPLELIGKMRPFQLQGVLYALEKRRTFIADEMGLGKTLQSLVSVETLQAFPVLVICPASLKYNWKAEILKWLPDRKTFVLDSSSILSILGAVIKSDAEFIICNYDILKQYEKAIKNHGFKAIIFDESHYLKNDQAKRTHYAREVSKTVDNIFCLTGTPVLNRPAELKTQLKIMRRLDEFGGDYGFDRMFTVQQNGRIIGVKNLDVLNTRLRESCYIRRNKKDVLKELPDKQQSRIELEISNRDIYDKAETDLIEYLRNEYLNDQRYLGTLGHLSGIAKSLAMNEYANSKSAKARMAEHLVRIEVLKQICARGKLKAVIEWIEDFLESDEKLVVFASHIEIQKKLLYQFPTAAHLFGEDNLEARDKNVNRFQNDPECRLILCSLEVGGLGINLTAASNVAFVELGWTPAKHDQAEDRLHRIGQNNKVMAYYFLGIETIDDVICDLLNKKRIVVNATLDGKDGGAQMNILSELVERLQQRVPRNQEKLKFK